MPLNHNDQFVVNAAQPSRRQIIEFKLSEEVLEEILNGNESIQLDLNQAKLLVGETPYDFSQMPGISNIEVYKLQSGSKQLDLVGDISAKCTIQRTHAKKGQKKATKHEPQRTVFRTNLRQRKGRKKGGSKLSGTAPVRRTLSPSPSPATAAVASAATTAAATAATAATAGTVVPLKTRVVQLLALHQRGVEEKELTKLLRVRIEDLQSILPIIANYSGGRYVLKPETYKEVKIYDWKNYSAKERDIVVNNASAAFDRLGLSSDAPERDILFPEKTKRASPPLVAEGYHVLGNMETTNSKWRSGGGGGGSESEGLDNGRMSSSGSSLLKPPTQKKTSAKKSPGTVASKTKKTSSSSKKAAAAAILDTVPNHSTRGAATPSSMKRTSETKKTGSKETGGVGNGYKIPKVGSGATIPRKPPSPGFTVPSITTQAEYEETSRKFMAKYKEMKDLKTRIDKKKELFDQLGAELERAMGTEREGELKRKIQDAFGEEIIDRKVLRRTGEPRNGISSKRAAVAIAERDKSLNLSVRSMAERYKTLHKEVDMMKRALWEAGTAQAERVGQHISGTSGGGNG
ncbi:hypothetical protein BGZ80_011471 [Entomortierella chlamydospora]|uniref:Uncharacterized protein n=1 Tax=Entomortierella chlamydospora TaxID=101097 RepID=A0A9P6SZ08_9FUNG|nr:hypothetical protein BGZ80_011471 [Entomortierella chlamydospora]